MGDSNEEELEPLFDYHRVQPVNFISFEDDSDSSPPISPKRRKISKSNNDKKEDNNNKDEKSIVVVDCDDEEDWLPPPPKNLVPTSKFEEDSTIKELRLKKQELASLARSAEDALRAVDEAAKKALSFSPTSSNEDTKEPPKPASNRAKIVISIQDKAGTKQCRVFKDESFEQLFRNYAEKAKIDIQSFAFCFDGDKIDPASTPQGLGMEDDDLIEVHVKKTR